jgi:hypothetical protein
MASARTLMKCALLAGLTSAAPEAQAGLATRYRPANLLGGYKDRLVEPGLWRVDARANGFAAPGFAQNMAAYRAADLLREAGFEYMQIIDQKGQSWSTRSGGQMGGTMTLWIKGAHNPDPPTDCRAKQPDLCLTVPVARTIERIRPSLVFPVNEEGPRLDEEDAFRRFPPRQTRPALSGIDGEGALRRRR